jgi:hypothetical protein
MSDKCTDTSVHTAVSQSDVHISTHKLTLIGENKYYTLRNSTRPRAGCTYPAKGIGIPKIQASVVISRGKSLLKKVL